MLNRLNQRELDLLRDELNTCTFLYRYLTESLEQIDRNLRIAQSPDLQWMQGGAQVLEELLDLKRVNQSP